MGNFLSVYKLNDLSPMLPEKNNFWIAESAHVIGNVHIGEQVGIWFGAILRGDNEPIIIGNRTNVQENTVIHVDEGAPVNIGNEVTIGHSSIIHGCSIGSNCLVGMGTIILNHAKIGNNSLVGAGALITEGKVFPDRSLIIGSPAKVKRELNDEEIKTISWSANHYIENLNNFSKNLLKIE